MEQDELPSRPGRKSSLQDLTNAGGGGYYLLGRPVDTKKRRANRERRKTMGKAKKYQYNLDEKTLTELTEVAVLKTVTGGKKKKKENCDCKGCPALVAADVMIGEA